MSALPPIHLFFEKAIGQSSDYDQAIGLAAAELDDEAVYENLAIEDIQRTADLLEPLYESTNGLDGYVSLEVSPHLANDTVGTVSAARRLWERLGRKNGMIKVPATEAGIPAIRQLISEGININVTLLFAIDAYEKVARAYIDGLEEAVANGNDINSIASVASFFVSRVDVLVDSLLEEAGNETLLGKIGIANAKAAYDSFEKVFSGERWEKLTEQGAKVQRPLWASTGTKNPSYPDTLYIDQLIGKDTVNTVPPKTLDAFLDHGTVATTLVDLDAAQAELVQLKEAGVDMNAVTDQLLEEGVDKFIKAFDALLQSVADKRAKLAHWKQMFSANLGDLKPAVNVAAAEAERDEVVRRIWEHDHTVWKPDPTEISNRLGWLHMPGAMRAEIESINQLRDSLLDEGYTDVVLMGMGGSSLAPELFMLTFGGKGLQLHVLDSTDANRVLEYEGKVELGKTLFIVATKSGGTVETLSFFKYFYGKTLAAVGDAEVGKHFVAITDPGSRLETLAKSHNFRATFLNDPTIGGRFAALSLFGLVPAALVGVDIEQLLDRAAEAVDNCGAVNLPTDGKNIGTLVGLIMAEAAKQGKDKLTFLTSPAIASFGDWVEQLVAESTGKDGVGILPVTGEAPAAPNMYGGDRLFVYLRLNADNTHDRVAQQLLDDGRPVLLLRLRDLYDIGQQFFLWEFATAVAGSRLGIQPFDQPNVESAKILARDMVNTFLESGALPSGETDPVSKEGLDQFLDGIEPGEYVALQAYIHPTPEADQLLQSLRTRIRDRYKVATTLGYGPRFLHSTGQLHKGDGGNGRFIQFVSTGPQDAPIPDEPGSESAAMSFNVLKIAQALGDAQALIEAGRKIIRLDLAGDVIGGLKASGRGIIIPYSI